MKRHCMLLAVTVLLLGIVSCGNLSLFKNTEDSSIIIRLPAKNARSITIPTGSSFVSLKDQNEITEYRAHVHLMSGEYSGTVEGEPGETLRFPHLDDGKYLVELEAWSGSSWIAYGKVPDVTVSNQKDVEVEVPLHYNAAFFSNNGKNYRMGNDTVSEPFTLFFDELPEAFDASLITIPDDAIPEGCEFAYFYVEGSLVPYERDAQIPFAGHTLPLKINAMWKTADDFVLIPAGTYMMGCNQEKGTKIQSNQEKSVVLKEERPVHKVTVSRPFFMCDHEVTQKEYIDSERTWNGTYRKSSWDKGSGDNYPAYYMNWFDAIAYCNNRSIAEHLTPCYTIKDSTDPSEWGTIPAHSVSASLTVDQSANLAAWNAVTCNFDADGYRLPTEAEFQLAARAGNLTTSNLIWAGTEDVTEIDDYAWTVHNNGATANNGDAKEVKQKLSNGYQLYDMSGNMWELCWDWYDWTNESYSWVDTTNADYIDVDPLGYTVPENAAELDKKRVNCGGPYNTTVDEAAVTARGGTSPCSLNGSNRVGIRLVRTVTE